MHLFLHGISQLLTTDFNTSCHCINYTVSTLTLDDLWVCNRELTTKLRTTSEQYHQKRDVSDSWQLTVTPPVCPIQISSTG